METTQQVKFKVFSGPNIVVPFPAVIAEFSVLSESTLSARSALEIASSFLPSDLRPPWKLTTTEVTLPTLSEAFSVAWSDFRGPNELPVQLTQISDDDGRWRLALGYYDADTTIAALELGIELANAVFARAAQAVVSSARLQALARRMWALAGSGQPGAITRAMTRIARSNDIPVYLFVPGSRIWMFGQGSKAFRFYASINENESFLGVQLVKDKILTDRALHRLGLPAVDFGIAETPEMARDSAHQIGYPVVVKPGDRDKGVGITLAIESDQELATAFSVAKGVSRSGVVMVERHYRGDHHRLSVFGGKFKRATQLTAAHVIGDGFRTVEELIVAENASRTTEDVAAGFVVRLAVDSEMIGYLAKQGYGLSDRPVLGAKLQLRKTSNIANGGKLQDVSALIHPDNVVLAETVARNFWLDAAGIDFVTPDISVSWRNISCAIIEVNSPPGITNDYLAEKALGEKFPPGQNGRILSVLIVEGNEDLQSSIVGRFAQNGLRVGTTNGSATYLNGEQRHLGSADLPARVLSLLLDPHCDVLVVGASAAELETHGLPHTRFDLAIMGADSGLTVRQLVIKHVCSVADAMPEGGLQVDLPIPFADGG